jgi:hypothetical protein
VPGGEIMKVKALTSFFTQNYNAVPGQVLTINDQQAVDNLVQSGYVEVMEENTTSPESVQEKHTSQQAKAKMKKSDDGR